MAEKSSSTSFWVRAAPKSWSKYATHLFDLIPVLSQIVLNLVKTSLVLGTKLDSCVSRVIKHLGENQGNFC